MKRREHDRRTVRIAIAGFGNVGRTLARLLLERQPEYVARYNIQVQLIAVWGSSKGIYCQEGLDQNQLDGELQLGQCGMRILDMAKPDILFEAGPSDFETGGPSLEIIRRSLQKGCHVICISKGALVFDGVALSKRASESNSKIKLSGAAGAALPCINLLRYSTLGCKVNKVEGILNATSNYLLDVMMTKRIGFIEARELLMKQRPEFAEADPSADCQGWDAACKLVLIAVFGLGIQITMADVSVNGIEAITESNVQQWHKQGVAPRLVASIAQQGDSSWQASVELKTYPTEHPFSLVHGKNKAVMISTDLMGDIFASACGPEPSATASSAMKDLELLLREEYSI